MRNLFIDFDGVVLDTVTLIHDGFHKNNVDLNNYEMRNQYVAKMDWRKLLNEASVINNGIENIKKLVASNKFKISILTHINSISEGEEKIKFINQILPDMDIILVPRNISKTLVTHTENSILVDDYSGNLKEWIDSGGIGIRFNTSGVDKGFVTIDSLDKLLEMDECFQ